VLFFKNNEGEKRVGLKKKKVVSIEEKGVDQRRSNK